jgi:ketosteroid isomerase-like protein
MATSREIADKLTDALLRGDIEAVASCYGDDAVLVAPEGTFRGREQIEEYWRAFHDAFSDWSVSILQQFDAGDASMDEWTFAATHTGELDIPGVGTAAPTGRRVTIRGADVGIVAGDVIAEHRLYYDQVEFLEQLGLMPAAA